MGRIEIYHDSIGNMLEQIAEGQSLHSFAVIPELVIDEQWKPMEGFRGEDRRFETGCDGVEREFLVLSFVDDGHDWIIVTTKCKHPNAKFGDDWRFVVRIEKDGDELSRSEMSVEVYCEYVSSRRRGQS